MNENNPKEEILSSFSSDREIHSKEEDRLGRDGFAVSLAKSIRNWTGQESLVIALYGKWGSGKSSIKNMVRETLEQEPEACPHIVEFNPWQWSGQDKLLIAFFNEINIALGKSDQSKKYEKLVKRWKKYAAYLRAGQFVFKVLPKLILVLLLIISALGFSNAFINTTWIKVVNLTIAGIALIFWFASEFSENISSIFRAIDEFKKKSLIEIKSDLRDEFLRLDRSILCIIDDVDRLSKEEIRLLFQLIKANGDFSNIIYFLLFQREIVEQSLEEIAPISGKEFLEKIVQVGFDIPKIEQTKLDRLLFNELDKILNHEKILKRFDKHRWGNLYYGGLQHYFKTLRDVKRFLSVFSFHVSIFGKEESFEVNPVDLIALEVLRTFEPNLYQNIPVNKSLFLDINNKADSQDMLAERPTPEINILLSKVKNENKEYATEILKQLFPPSEWMFGGLKYSNSSYEEWFRDLRVCDKNLFDRYFQLSIPENDISQYQIERILSLANNRELLLKEFQVFNSLGLLGILFNRLEAYKQKIPIHHHFAFVTAIMDIGDELPDVTIEELTVDWNAIRIIHWYLMQEPDIKKRGEYLRQSIQSTTGLYLPVFIVSIENDKHERKNSSSLMVDEDLLKFLSEMCLHKIKEAAVNGKLASSNKLAYILYRWKEWENVEEPKKWVNDFVETKEGVFNFISAFLKSKTSYGGSDYVGKVHWYISLKEIEDFIDHKILKEKIKKNSHMELTSNQKLAITIFENALKKRDKGKPDDAWDYDVD